MVFHVKHHTSFIRLQKKFTILRKFTENIRPVHSIAWLYKKCQQNKPTRNHSKFPKIEPFLLLSPFSLPGVDSNAGVSFFQRRRQQSQAGNMATFPDIAARYIEVMSDATENNAIDGNPESNLIGRESNVVPGRFGEPLQVTQVQYSRGGGNTAPRRPLFLCLHGWGSNEEDLADMMRYVAPYNDFASLRAPLVLQEAGFVGFGFSQGAYSWFHDCVPSGDDLDRDAYAAAVAIDNWVSENVTQDRSVVPIGFSQGGLLAIHLLRVNPERYLAAISLSGFLAPGSVAGTAPADDRLAPLNKPVFYGYGNSDTVIPKPELFATAAWLDEHTFLTSKSYRGLDHSVSLEEFSDLRAWLANHDIAPGVL